MSEPIDEVLESWRSHPDVAGCLVHEEAEPARRGTFSDLDPPLTVSLGQRLGAAGIDRLYRHQTATIGRVRSGTHTVVVAGTASGKSLTYQIPIAEATDEDPAATALLVHPTKALTRDQLRGISRLDEGSLQAAVYDGDTPQEERRWIRGHANVVLTNPDMLHVGILPNHGAWKPFLGGLRYVVIDEMHVFRGAFGTHAALVFRRLRRIARMYGADPVFVITSATIGNPADLAAALVGAPVDVVDEDTAPRGPRRTVLWNPELEDPDTGKRASTLHDATRAFCDLVSAGAPTIMFARSRKATELSFRRARERLDGDTAARIAAYRSGYLPAARRDIEQRLFSGELLGVTTTNALELGIDVGGLDAAVLSSFPGTIASFRQQSGRAGRTTDDSLTVLVAGSDALDQYYMTHPDELFSRKPEAAVVNPDNPTIAASHIQCAAHEAPLEPGDRQWFGEGFEELVTDLVGSDRLGIRGTRIFWNGGRSPAPTIDIRSSGGRSYVIADGDGTLLGSVDEGRAFSQCHGGAVYLHQGDSYIVDRLDLDQGEVRVHRAEAGYYTQPHVEKDVHVLEVAANNTLGPIGSSHGTVEVTTRVIDYRRKDIRTGATLDTTPLDLPERRFRTQAVWFTFPDALFDDADVDRIEVPAALHAAEHTAIGVLPLFAVCDRWDVGGLSTATHPDTGLPVFFIYDGYPGGTGIAPIAHQMAAAHLAATLRTLETCPCRDGCPSCVQSPKCGNYNEFLDKHSAGRLLATALG